MRSAKIIVIGWRAQEQHFLELLTHLPDNISILVVAQGPTDVQQTSEALQRHGVKGAYSTAKHGFSRFLEDEELLDGFLWT